MAIKSSKDKGAKPSVKKEGEEVKMAEGDAKTITPDMVEDLYAQIAELKGKIEPISEELDIENPVDDYLEEPIVFFSFSSHYSIFSDKRYNREVLPPRGEPVVFEKLYRYKRRSKLGRGIEVVSVSQVVVHSKSTVEWLRNHSLYGIKFFENINKAKNVNVTLAEKMAEMNAVVTNMNDMQVIERAKRENIDISNPDLHYIRQMLTRKMAEDAMKNEKEAHITKMQAPKVIERKATPDVDVETEQVY